MNLTIEDLAVVERVKKEVVREVTQEVERLLARDESGLEAARVQAAGAVVAAFLGSSPKGWHQVSGVGAPPAAVHDAVWAASAFLKSALDDATKDVKGREKREDASD